eukprot:TRINITY_DN61578_c0_g1_i1.p1 TRINITY_DN61578_c0_g1~~TRINITY_DN61578_c0_g1_i1.p1  ORF type:complete len:576 (-),score=20.34 TRINITY_DN61578_c0_g1_i1:485-2038(-)
MLAASPALWSARDEHSATLLHWAARIGSPEFVKTALSNKIEVDSKCSAEQTPLMWATRAGNVHGARVLLDARADPSCADNCGATCLMVAVQDFEHHLLLYLMSHGGVSLLKAPDGTGRTGAHWAALVGNITALRFMQYFGAAMDATDARGRLPIHYATDAAHVNCVSFLVECLCDVGAVSAEGLSSLDIASQNDNSQIWSMLKRSPSGQGRLALSSTAGFGLDGPMLPASSRRRSRRSVVYRILSESALSRYWPMLVRCPPIVWHVCVLLVVVEYVRDLRSRMWVLLPVAAFCFECGVLFSLCMFHFVSYADPGIVQRGALGATGVEQLMRLMHCASLGEELPAISRLCPTTLVLKGPRMKYSTAIGECVQGFDHQCFILNVPIGAGNHRAFILLLAMELFTQSLYYYFCSVVGAEVVDSAADQFPSLAGLWTLQGLSIPGVFILLLLESLLIGANMTANEAIHAGRYSVFWTSSKGRRASFRNPFSKGSVRRNCLDFWCNRRHGFSGCGAADLHEP